MFLSFCIFMFLFGFCHTSYKVIFNGHHVLGFVVINPRLLKISTLGFIILQQVIKVTAYNFNFITILKGFIKVSSVLAPKIKDTTHLHGFQYPINTHIIFTNPSRVQGPSNHNLRGFQVFLIL